MRAPYDGAIPPPALHEDFPSRVAYPSDLYGQSDEYAFADRDVSFRGLDWNFFEAGIVIFG